MSTRKKSLFCRSRQRCLRKEGAFLPFFLWRGNTAAAAHDNVASKRKVHFCPLSFRGAILPLPPTTMLPPKGMCISALFPFEGQYCRCRPRHVNTYSICALKGALSTRFNQVMNIKPEGAQHRSIQDRKGLLVEHNEEWCCLQ